MSCTACPNETTSVVGAEKVDECFDGSACPYYVKLEETVANTCFAEDDCFFKCLRVGDPLFLPLRVKSVCLFHV